MEIWLAVIAFCSAQGCAFFVSNDTYKSRSVCEENVLAMEEEVQQHFRGQVDTIPGCVKVPIKVI
jgi:hypothetical protein